MQAIFTRNLCTKTGLKIMAFVIGCSFWYWLHVDTVMNKECLVPVYFYDVQNYDIKPEREDVQITLRGSRRMLHDMHAKSCAIHINAADLAEGENEIYVCDQKIFLPDHMKLVNCTPHVIGITKTKHNLDS